MPITPNPYILNPFGIDGDGTPIDNAGGGNAGTVTYQYGWTPNYEEPSSTPGYLPVPRLQMNQVLCDISYGVQTLQTQGFPFWIAPSGSPTASGPASYPIYAYVAYDAGSGVQIWESQVASNTSVPGADLNWVVVSGNAQGIRPGTMVDFAGPIVPAGYLWCNGIAVSRAIYFNLESAITMNQSSVLSIGVPTFTVTTTLTFDPTQIYIGMPIESTGFPAGTTVINYAAGTVTASQNASANDAHNVTFFPWGNGDGSTTFNVPDYRGYVAMGNGGPVIVNVIGSSTGQGGGESAHTLTVLEMPNHNHPGSTVSFNRVNTQVPYQGSSPAIYPVSASASGVTISPEGGSGAHNNIQPSRICTKCIKY